MKDIFSRMKEVFVQSASKVRDEHIWLMMCVIYLLFSIACFSTDTWNERLLRLTIIFLSFVIFRKCRQIEQLKSVLMRCMKLLSESVDELRKIIDTTKEANDDEKL